MLLIESGLERSFFYLIICLAHGQYLRGQNDWLSLWMMVGLGLLGTCKWLRLGLYQLLSVVEDCISVVRASLLFMRTRKNLSAMNSAVHLTRS